MDDLSEHEATLAAANSLENPLKGLESLLEVKIGAKTVENDDGATTSIEYRSSRLSDKLEKQCLQLFEDNMGHLYTKSSWGLDMKEKQEELQHEHAKFLVVADASKYGESGELLAFCHFRFDWNDDDEPTEAVLYVYEIQVDERMRRSGLGRRLMTILELVARQAGLSKTMLTVFKDNAAAWNFYTKKLKYKVDETSPSLYGEEVDYEILSKRVR